MSFAIELNKRQSTRTIEQALRRQVETTLEPRVEGGGEPLVGMLAQDRSELFTFDLARDPGRLLDRLVGAYCEGHFQLGESRYLFSTYVIDTVSGGRFGRLVVQRPETILVVQRRRFWRTRFAESSDVRPNFQVDGHEETVLGALCNVSPEGLAMRLSDRFADGMLIGDKMRAGFELPGLDYTFEFDAILCNKTPAGSPGALILGLQFSGLEEAEEQMILLRNHLRHENRAGMRQGAGE